MKRILFGALALTTLLVMSCKNDDIEITTVGSLHSLTANINTQNVYDEFDLTSEIREIMRVQDLSIGIFTFLYDSNGKLIAEKASQQLTFNNTAVNFDDLLEGSYTLVTVETLVDPDLDNQAPCWSFKGTEKLSTLQILQDSYEIYYPFVLGVSTSEVAINNGDKSISITPKAIGSLMEFRFLNFDKSTHTQVCFATKDVISSYRLDPSLNRNDRFNTNLTRGDTVTVRCEQDVDDNIIKATRYILESSIDYSFVYVKAENEGTGNLSGYASNEGTLVLEDAKTYFGGFYYVDSSTSPKSYFGDYSGFKEWYTQVTAINTNNGLIPSSISMNWGSTVTSVQNAMNNYTQTTGSSGRAILQDDGSYMIDYAGKGKESKILYFFTSATTGLFEADVQFNKSTVSSSEILAYLNANYTYLAEESGTYMYYTSDKKTYVLFFEVEGVWNIGFVDANYIDNTGVKAYVPHHIRKASTNVEITKTAFVQSLRKEVSYKNVKNVK